MHPAVAVIDQSLRALTDFQHATVEAVCERLDGPTGLGGRTLVADEVGLGKTLVARGVVARMLRRRLELGAPTKPFRVVYVCSNLALAHENVGKLAIFRGADAKRWVNSPSFGRLAELGLEQEAAADGVLIELCSLTPATSFSLTQGDGNARERYIIWRAVESEPYVETTDSLESFFRKDVGPSWDAVHGEYRARADEGRLLEQSALRDFRRRLSLSPRLDARTRDAAEQLELNLRSWRTLLVGVSQIDQTLTRQQKDLVSHVRVHIRRMFVESCAQNLKADLFILDEFQRFRELLEVPPENAAGRNENVVSEQHVIARRVLHQAGAYSTLLLSATPFKALCHIEEEDQGKAHGQELSQLLHYLCSGQGEVVDNYQAKREALLTAILELPAGGLTAGSLSTKAKEEVESVLRAYICRTERAGIIPEIEHTLKNVLSVCASPGREEIDGFIALDHLSEAVKEAYEGPVGNDVMQFHKAAPWSLSFLGEYKLREQLLDLRSVPSVKSALKESGSAWIPRDRLGSFRLDLTRDAPSERFRQVLQVAAPHGAERLLWLPPSLPYHESEGPFKTFAGFSKTLLFSSLVLAPRALSSFVSYECERRLLPTKGRHAPYFDPRGEETTAFRFDEKSISTAWSLAYPSARLGSALQFSRRGETLAMLREHVRSDLTSDYTAMAANFGRGSPKRGAKWYVLAPFLLDWTASEASKRHIEQWFASVSGLKIANVRNAQISRISDAVRRRDLELGPPPADLLDYLVDVAIAGPGLCMARSLSAVWERSESQDELRHDVLALATEAGLSFVDKMNRAESQRVLRAVCGGGKPWVAVAKYSAMGNLQAVFDEYMHLLKSTYGTIEDSVDAFRIAIGVGAVSVAAQYQLPPRSDVKRFDVRFHCHYAVPLGNQKRTDEKGVNRITNVRAAFNSPFWPFMLNSTSIGQEGLDFHWYCRRIVHWNLPSNPIDLEQREGRINRYKSLVVRQRAAEVYGGELSRTARQDLWTTLFEAAAAANATTDLIPFWHVPDGTAIIERIVPAMPFSAEIARLDEILRILSLYRLSFGQPRQQELVENLLRRSFSEADLAEIRRALLIDLAPVNYLMHENGRLPVAA